MLADGRREKTVTLIGNSAEITDHKKNRHAELLAGDKQTVARNIDAGVFHINGALFPAQCRPDGDGYRLLFARGWNQFHGWIVTNQRHDLGQARLGQIAH